MGGQAAQFVNFDLAPQLLACPVNQSIHVTIERRFSVEHGLHFICHLFIKIAPNVERSTVVESDWPARHDSFKVLSFKKAVIMPSLNDLLVNRPQSYRSILYRISDRINRVVVIDGALLFAGIVHLFCVRLWPHHPSEWRGFCRSGRSGSGGACWQGSLWLLGFSTVLRFSGRWLSLKSANGWGHALNCFSGGV